MDRIIRLSSHTCRSGSRSRRSACSACGGGGGSVWLGCCELLALEPKCPDLVGPPYLGPPYFFWLRLVCESSISRVPMPFSFGV